MEDKNIGKTPTADRIMRTIFNLEADTTEEKIEYHEQQLKKLKAKKEDNQK